MAAPDTTYDVRLEPICQGTVVTAIAVYARDVTDRKRAAKLLEEAKSQAERANEAKTTFLAHLSHEIRTPLAAVLGMAELALEGAMDPRQRGLLASVRSNAEALLALVGETLDVSRIETGRIELGHEPYSPVALIETVVSTFAIAAGQKNLKLHCEIESTLPGQVMGDAQRVRQVITNLVGNAVKYTDEGIVKVRADYADNALLIEVVDTGRGLSEEEVARVFEPFFRADGVRMEGVTGSGLGLAITKRLVEHMDGELTVESVMGEGSTFAVRFPMPEVQAAASERMLDGVMVLLGTADASLERSTRMSLEASGAEVTSVGDGATLLSELMVFERMPVLCIDLSLPGPAPTALAMVAQDLAEGQPSRVVGLASVHELHETTVEALDAIVALPSTRSALERAILGQEAASEAASVSIVRPLDILVVDDRVENIVLVRRALEKHHHRVTQAMNGMEALECLWHTEFDLVFMDVDMPVLDGIEATRRLRAHETSTNGTRTPVVALTAHVTDAVRRACMAAGMDDFITKPFTHESLLASLYRLVDRDVVVWVVDDDVNSQQLLTHYLEGSGATTRCFLGSLEMLAALEEGAMEADVLLTDVELPGMRGPDLVRTLRSRGITIPVVAMSAHIDGSVKNECMDAGCDAYLVKPVRKESLADTLQGLMSAPPDLEDDLDDLRGMFVRVRLEELDQAPACLADGDYDTVRRLGHSLKGTARPYGFVELEALGGQLEVAAGEHNRAVVEDLLIRIREGLTR